MNPIAHQHTFAPFQRDDFAGGRSFQAEQSRAGSLSVSQSTAIILTTEEGDRVTLNLSTATETKAGTYLSLAYAEGRAAASQAGFFEQSSSEHMAVEIEGDLNDEEMAEIQEAVRVIGGMMDDFLSGDLQGMAEDAEVLQELDTISSLEAAFSYERQVMYGQEERVAMQTEAPAHGGRRTHPHLQGLMQRMDRLTDDMTDQVKVFHEQRQSLVQSVDELLNQYRDEAMRPDRENALAMDVIKTIQAAFLEKVGALTDEQPEGGETNTPAN
jgi:hypothetical protein